MKECRWSNSFFFKYCLNMFCAAKKYPGLEKLCEVFAQHSVLRLADRLHYLFNDYKFNNLKLMTSHNYPLSPAMSDMIEKASSSLAMMKPLKTLSFSVKEEDIQDR